MHYQAGEMEILAYTYMALSCEETTGNLTNLDLLESSEIFESKHANITNILVVSEFDRDQDKLMRLVPLFFEPETNSYIPLNHPPLF